MEVLLGEGGQGVKEGAGALLCLLGHPGHEVLDAVGEERLLAGGGRGGDEVVEVWSSLLERAAPGCGFLLPGLGPGPRLLAVAAVAGTGRLGLGETGLRVLHPAAPVS